MTNRDHLNSLAAHGAKVGSDHGWVTPDEDFYNAELDNIHRYSMIVAITYDLKLPDLDGDFAITIWRDGHIDSGSRESMQRILNR